MPLMLSIQEVRPGMRVTGAAINNGRILLPVGHILTETDIRVLHRSYSDLSLRVGDPILDRAVDFEDDTHDLEVARQVQRKITDCVNEVFDQFASRTSLAGMDTQAIEHSMGTVLEYLNANPVTAALLAKNSGGEDYLIQHAGNVFYLSMLIGTAMRDYVASERKRQTSAKLNIRPAQHMVPLGLGAIFCDLGMLPLQHLFKSDKPLTQQERLLLHQHPMTGADMLPGNFSPVARSIVRSHHENFDGSGYPRALPGNKLHIFSRIVRITDSYDAATTTHLYKKAKSPARALWDMKIGPNRRFYDPALIEVFTRLIQPFPIGTKLRLADGRYAVVTRYNREDPFAPTVVIAFDEHGKRLADDRLEGPFDLATRHDLRLQYYGKEDISYIYDINDPRDAATTRGEPGTSFVYPCP